MDILTFHFGMAILSTIILMPVFKIVATLIKIIDIMSLCLQRTNVNLAVTISDQLHTDRQYCFVYFIKTLNNIIRNY